MTRCQRRHSVLSDQSRRLNLFLYRGPALLSCLWWKWKLIAESKYLLNKSFYTNQNFVEVINTRHLKLCSNSHSRSIVKVTIPMYIFQAGLNLKEAWQAFVSVCKSPVVCLKLLLQCQLCCMQLVTVLLIWSERKIYIGNQAENYSNGKLCANDSHSRCGVNVNFQRLSCFTMPILFCATQLTVLRWRGCILFSNCQLEVSFRSLKWISSWIYLSGIDINFSCTVSTCYTVVILFDKI